MKTAHELFAAKTSVWLRQVADERRPDAIAAIEKVFRDAPTGDPATIGKVVGPQLKQIEKLYLAPPTPTLSREQMLQSLHAAGSVTDARFAELSSLLGEPGVGHAVNAAHGVLGSDPVTAYNMIEGFMFEQSRRHSALIRGATEQPREKVRVDFWGLRDGVVSQLRGVAIDNDVPVYPGWIWETKRYTRLNYGGKPDAINQLLKYQAAVDTGRFKGAILEICGNIDPAFMRALIDGVSPAPGLTLYIPDIEVIYVPDAPYGVGEAYVLRENQARDSPRRRLLNKPHNDVLVAALAAKDYGLFAREIVDFDAEGCRDPAAFRNFERRLFAERRERFRAYVPSWVRV